MKLAKKYAFGFNYICSHSFHDCCLKALSRCQVTKYVHRTRELAWMNVNSKSFVLFT